MTIEGTHIAISDFTADTKIQMWIENLDRSPIGRERVLDALGFQKRTLHRGKMRIEDLPCIVCGATSPTADPTAWTVFLTEGTYPDSPGGFGCEIGNHRFSLPRLIEQHCATKPKKKKLLEKIRIHEPRLARFYGAEREDQREVSNDPQRAISGVLGPVHDCKVRLVGIEAPSLEIARQVIGQCHDDLPWATVDLELDGTIIDPGWHRGRLTEQERIRATQREEAVRMRNIRTLEADVAAYRRARAQELGL